MLSIKSDRGQNFSSPSDRAVTRELGTPLPFLCFGKGSVPAPFELELGKVTSLSQVFLMVKREDVPLLSHGSEHGPGPAWGMGASEEIIMRFGQKRELDRTEADLPVILIVP